VATLIVLASRRTLLRSIGAAQIRTKYSQKTVVLQNDQTVIRLRHLMFAAHQESGTDAECFVFRILFGSRYLLSVLSCFFLNYSLYSSHYSSRAQLGLLPSRCAVVHACGSVRHAPNLLPMILFSHNFSDQRSTARSQQPRI